MRTDVSALTNSDIIKARHVYAVKEIFLTHQGEGYHAGRVAVFCRFTGCNLWSGREKDRSTATCQFCDTDFVGMDGTKGGSYPDAQTLADAIASEWIGEHVAQKWEPVLRNNMRPNNEKEHRFCVLTGGEPLLQVDSALCEALHAHGFTIAVETNGTCDVPNGIDWVCVSPKAGAALKATHGHELKLVYPQPHALPENFSHLSFQHFYLQPMDGVNATLYTQQAIAYSLAHPQWKLSVQTHKMIGIR
jgi:7-carboxy-7-deazaguanine synthase